MRFRLYILSIMLLVAAVFLLVWISAVPASDPHAGHGSPTPAPPEAPATPDASAPPDASSDFDELKSMDMDQLQQEGKMQELAPGSVQISPERQQMIGVKLGKVEKRRLQKSVRTVGRIEYDEKRVGIISTKIAGWVEDLFADFMGRFVSKGHPLLTIYSPELVSTQEEYLLAVSARQRLKSSPFPARISSLNNRLRMPT